MVTMYPLSIPPIHLDVEARVKMTASCTDCAAIPKVWNAGHVAVENGLRVQIMHNGLKVVADGYHGKWMTKVIAELRGHHEPQQELVFHELLKHVGPVATMIELGGHWSYYSLWFLHGRDERRAFVVEPDTWNISVGRRNARLNQARIHFEQACAGPEAVAAMPFRTAKSGQLTMPQVSVASLMQQHGIDVLDVLHCNLEGAETAILQSCQQLFASNRIRFAVISTHSQHVCGDPLMHQRCLAMLRDFGVRVLAEHDVHEGFGGAGLIVAYAGTHDLRWSPPPLSRNRYSSSLYRNPLFELARA